ncbi:MCM2/3/5 family-domain-containing protein, partial [Paraphysoderma sedebokerense]
YLRQIVSMKETESTTVVVDFAHLFEYNQHLATAVQKEFERFHAYLCRAIQNLVRKYIPSYLYISIADFGGSSQDESMDDNATEGMGKLMRDFWISFTGIRDSRPADVGSLLSFSGTVTRTSEVRPELRFGTFECRECKTLAKDVEQQFNYTEPLMCKHPLCQNRINWDLLISQSKFTDWQKVRVQENASEMPSGAMPRSIEVILRNEMVEKAKAGDKVQFTGMLIAIPDVSQLNAPGSKVEGFRGDGGRGEGLNEGVTGLKALGAREMSYRLAFLACHAIPVAAAKLGMKDANGLLDEESHEVLMEFTKDEIDELRTMVSNPQIYNALTKSIAPQVFGHDEIKRGILLQLMGGVHKTTSEGINLRGDLNICIVGDPSTSKSQFLKYVCSFMPRSVYTSGKASSAAGLTAAVIKDEETGEFAIEAGALMLADNGICAIDEFDKMDIKDQVAIHEAMEQQTISIAKAGIQATLNARASILAAANPVHGRYDKKLTLRQNIAMSAPIMSRFDLFFVVLDECDQATDYNIARHIVNVHRFTDDMIDPEYSTDQVQKYIRFAKTFRPKITPEAKKLLVEQYRALRQNEATSAKWSHRITVRQLESMIRLSEALARVHCDEYVTPRYVREAYRLLQKSIIHVETSDIELDEDLDGRPDLAVARVDEGVAQVAGSVEVGEDRLDHGDNNVNVAAQETENEPREQETGRKGKEKHTIDTATFQKITNMLVMHLRQFEDLVTKIFTGVRRSELMQWYLDQMEDEIQTVERLNAERKKIKMVIKHLVKKVCSSL